MSSGVLDEAGVPGLREITVRSMMGDFAGNAGLMSLWFDEEIWDWKFEFVNCGLGTQHIWWTVHIWDLINVILILVYSILTAVNRIGVLDVHKNSLFESSKKHSVKKASPASPASLKGHAISKPRANGSVSKEDLFENGTIVKKLELPGSGKKSLRRKKSKASLNGSANGSVLSMYS